MGWKTEQHKVGNGQQELQVSIKVKEMIDTWATNSESWISHFKNKLSEISRTNSYSAEYGYKAIAKDHTTVEVWKMKVNGDFNYKMFTSKFSK
ncbi:MAG: hypothetical protein ABIP27_17575 [Flavobacterium circumlabens]|uniref:hypothetical protein n=1 Tax=Flavobacterium circumlabens TaxID=2133765 RepID=UPI0032642ACC